MLKALLAKVFLENLENEPFGTHRCPQYHANFLFKLAIKINNIQSIKTASATKGKWSDFSFPFLGTISPKEHHCWYQYILGQLITQDNSWPLAFRRAMLSIQSWTRGRSCTFHWKTNFRSSFSTRIRKTFPFCEVLPKLLDRLSAERPSQPMNCSIKNGFI